MTARSAEDPVAISVEVSMIGWVKLKLAPGISARSRCDSSLTRSRLGLPRRPGVVRLAARSSSSLRFGPNGSVPSSLRPVCDMTSLDLGRLEDELPHARRPTSADFCERDAGREVGPDPDDPLVELGQELRRPLGRPAKRLPPTTRRGRRRRSRERRGPRRGRRARSRRPASSSEPVPAHARAGGEEIAGQRRDEGEGQDQRAQQGDSTTVSAIGVKSRRSTRSSVRSGM